MLHVAPGKPIEFQRVQMPSGASMQHTCDTRPVERAHEHDIVTFLAFVLGASDRDCVDSQAPELNQMSHVESDLAADLLWGVEEIARFIGVNKRKAHHAIACGNLPVKRMGKLIVGSKAALRKQFTVVDDEKAAP
jgi:hypothetical protein